MQIVGTAPIVTRPVADEVPGYRIVSRFKPVSVPGMPGPYPGRVVSIKSSRDPEGAEIVREMLLRGMLALTGETTADAAWRRFFSPSDVVGIKVNCGGRPWVVSSPAIVSEVVKNLMAVGLKESQIIIYERFQDQLNQVNYVPHVPKGVGIVAAESSRGERRSYDPNTYVEADFFGEEDTRSNMMRLVTERVTKIINIPNMKDHGATGVTGCLKNISYGSFSNVARTHRKGKSFTYSFVGTLAAVEPLRSRTVLQIMDGLRAVWHGGPFASTKRYVFSPRQIMIGTDPVAIDRLLLDIIDAKRKAEGAISIWDRSPKYLKIDNVRARDLHPGCQHHHPRAWTYRVRIKTWTGRI